MKLPMKLPDKGSVAFAGILIAAALLFFFYILGFSGARSALGMTLIFILPTYFILNNLKLDNDEKIIFAFFIGVGIFPSAAYWLGTLISFRASISATFILLLIAGFLIKKFAGKRINAAGFLSKVSR